MTVPDLTAFTGLGVFTPGFEKIRGDIPVYAERGDVILHDAYLWHSVARHRRQHDAPPRPRRLAGR